MRDWYFGPLILGRNYRRRTLQLGLVFRTWMHAAIDDYTGIVSFEMGHGHRRIKVKVWR